MRRSMIRLLLLLAALPAASAVAQTWPARPIRIVVPYPPGGQTDIVSRWMGERLQAALGQPFVIDNRPGAQGILGIGAVKQAAPDGYTIGYANLSNLVINRFAYAKLPYDAPDDFEMISQIGLSSLGMIVPSASGLKSVDDFVRHVRAHPGKSTFASFGAGSSSHLYGEMLKSAARLDMVHVPYKGAAPAVQDVIAGNATMAIQDFAATGPFIQSGRATLLAVTGPKRWPLYPEVRTFTEQGYPLDLAGWNGFIAPKGTPRAIIERLSQEINRAIQSPEGRAKMLEMGLLATGTSPSEFAEIVRRDTPRWGEVFKGTGLTPQ